MIARIISGIARLCATIRGKRDPEPEPSGVCVLCHRPRADIEHGICGPCASYL
jgi:hypothetical protein